jgi:hypothetical protein
VTGTVTGHLTQNEENEVCWYVNNEITLRLIFQGTLSRPFKTPLLLGYRANGQDEKTPM